MSDRKLQRLIDRAAAANEAAFHATTALNAECERRYGIAPSDVDADEIIDAVLGGQGSCAGMDAMRFDIIMRDLMP